VTQWPSSNVTMVAAGGDYTVVVDAGGVVWTAGAGNSGQTRKRGRYQSLYAGIDQRD